MAQSFHKISRSLRADSGIPALAACGIAAAFVGAWCAWALCAHVTRYELSYSARLETSAAAYPLQSSLSGELVVSNLRLGSPVGAGDILIELDSRDEQLNLRSEQTKLESMQPELAAIRAQLDAEERGGDDERSVAAVAAEGANAQVRDAEAQAAAAESAAGRAEQLRAEGILAAAEAERLSAEAKSKRAIADSLRAASARLQPELRVHDGDRQLRLKQILEDERKLEVEIAESKAAVERLRFAVEQRRLRAPASGILSECAVLRPGAHISEGQQLGIIVPDASVHVVAQFTPAAALGKIHSGQPATVRLDGFPWTHYGTISARVANVAGDIRDGHVRVELAILNAPSGLAPLRHGLPGSVEVAVERTTPAALLLRSAGAP